MLPQCIAVLSRKGGVGKTSIAAALSGLLAAAGWRTLAVDLDPQGDLGWDLGYHHTDRSDGGTNLAAALRGEATPAPLRDIRPGLDVLPGGLAVEAVTGPGADPGALRVALAAVADTYQLIILDCPPQNRVIQRMALTAAAHVIIPTKADDASIEGLVQVADLFAEVRAGANPLVQVLGVALFGIGRATTVTADARAAIAGALGVGVLFDSHIRHVEAVAADVRGHGRLPHELEDQLPQFRAERSRWLRSGTGGRHRPGRTPRVPTSAAGLAEDYHALAAEVVSRYTAAVSV